MTASDVLRHAIKWGGRAIVGLALAFLVWKAREHWAVLSAWKPTPQTALLLLACSVLYGVGMLFIAESWHHIVSGLSSRPVSRLTTWPSFGVTQVAKYLPGNVFHYVGRHMWLKREGVTHRAALMATAWEVVLMAGTALGCASLVVMIWPFGIAGLPAATIGLLAATVAAGLLLVLICVLIAGRKIPRLAEFMPPQRCVILSPLALTGFFLLQGGVFCLLFIAVGAEPPPYAVAVAIVSWLVGYATPGAPGGIGSREAMMVALTTPITGSADALILAALFRVVTTLADLVCFGMSSLIARASGAPDPETV